MSEISFDLSDLAVEEIHVISADSLGGSGEGHGMTELAASCSLCEPTPSATGLLDDEDDLN
jgi:hypothetical protein